MPCNVYNEVEDEEEARGAFWISGGEGFYITLPSNASAHVFKNNTGSSFHVVLAQHIDLEGPWQVALMEISYLHTWHNIPQDVAYFEWRKKPTTPDEVTLVNHRRFRGGYYDLNFRQAVSIIHAFFRPRLTYWA
ncbi:hypothetical protein ABVT39_023224 [Epinephelus coioides]